MADVWISSVLAAGSAVAVGVFARMAAAVRGYWYPDPLQWGT